MGETKFSAASKPVFRSSVELEHLRSAHAVFPSPVSTLHASDFTRTLFSFVGLSEKSAVGPGKGVPPHHAPNDAQGYTPPR